MRANRLTLVVAAWCAAMMAALYQPFITIWTKGSPDLVRHALTALLMVVLFCVNMSRQVLIVFKSAAALWKQDRWKPIVAGVVNLTICLSLLKVLPDAYKVDGVIFATIISYLVIQIPWESHVVFSKFFDGGQAAVYWRAQARFAALVLALCAVSCVVACSIQLDGVAGFVAKGSASAAASALILFILFRRDVVLLFKILAGKSR